MKLYRVRFSRPDGTEAWLGESGCGPTDDPTQSPTVDYREANYLAAEREWIYGSRGWRYWLVEVGAKSEEGFNHAADLQDEAGQRAKRVRDRTLARDTVRKSLDVVTENLPLADYVDLLKWLKLEVEARLEAIGEED